MSVRGSKQNLRVEVEYYLEMERKARIKWRKQMSELEAQESPSVLLALSGDKTIGENGGGAKRHPESEP